MFWCSFRNMSKVNFWEGSQPSVKVKQTLLEFVFLWLKWESSIHITKYIQSIINIIKKILHGFVSLFYLVSSFFLFYIKNRILPSPQTITYGLEGSPASQIQLERAFHLLPHHHKKLSQACLELSIDDKLRQWWILKASLEVPWIHCFLKASILIPSWPPYIRLKGDIELTLSRSIQIFCWKITMYTCINNGLMRCSRKEANNRWSKLFQDKHLFWRMLLSPPLHVWDLKQFMTSFPATGILFQPLMGSGSHSM